MNRFFGMMPSNCIEKEEHYRDSNGLSIIIQAGPEGWSILWADGGSNFKDADTTTDQNFDEAFKFATDVVGELTKVSPSSEIEVLSEC